MSSFPTKAREHCDNQKAWALQREIEIELLKDREKMFDCDSSSVKNKLVRVKVENACLKWSRVNFDEKLMTLEKDVNVAIKAATDSSQQSDSPIAFLIESRFSEH